MNKQRRARLESLIDKLTEIRDSFIDIMDEIESIKDEEQEAMDNMPESLQETDRYYDMESNVDDLDNASGCDYDSLLDELESYLQDVIDR